MNSKSITKLPRLYSAQDLKLGQSIELEASQAHYLKNVLRKGEGDRLRVFNGRDGEWVCNLMHLSKKNASINPTEQIKEQASIPRRVHIFFSPIKKQRMDFLIEKAVELGATDLHPVLTQNTETRKINEERIKAQIIEASEQCERLDLPKLHVLCDFKSIIKCDFEILAAIERIDAQDIKTAAMPKGNIGFFAGPEGGFTQEEKVFMQDQAAFTPVSLGNNILRAETAFLKFLSIL